MRIFYGKFQVNFYQKISLEDIAASASISTREALRCFQSSIHETPFEYLISYRIQTAKKLLKSTNLSVTEIAIRTGFAINNFFSCKIFFLILLFMFSRNRINNPFSNVCCMISNSFKIFGNHQQIRSLFPNIFIHMNHFY